MKGEISRIILFVDDIGKMSEFYRGVFGLDELPGSSIDFVCFGAGGCQICLHSIPVEYRSKDNEYPRREDTYVKFVFYSDNVEADRSYLVERGVRMKDIVRFGSIEFCDGADPEGNVFQISSR